MSQVIFVFLNTVLLNSLNFWYNVFAMKKVNVSTKNIRQFAGKWVVIDPIKDKVIAVADTLKEIDSLITRAEDDKRASGTVPAAFKVPRTDEGPYILGAL